MDTSKVNIQKKVRYDVSVSEMIKKVDKKLSPVEDKSFFESIPKHIRL
jgi:hypothetical protein